MLRTLYNVAQSHTLVDFRNNTIYYIALYNMVEYCFPFGPVNRIWTLPVVTLGIDEHVENWVGLWLADARKSLFGISY